MFVDPATGDVYQEGDVIFLPDLGATMTVLQQEPDALYTGSLSAKLLEDLNAFGSNITAADLADYTSVTT